MHENIDRILFTEDEIKQRVAEIGAGITQDYKDDPDGVILISVLRGAAIFMADLARQIQLPCEMDYMAVSSYGNGVKSSGVVRILKDLSSQIEGRNVVIAEDVLDSGLTLTYLLKTLKARNPKSIEVATLLRKKTRAQANDRLRIRGLRVPRRVHRGLRPGLRRALPQPAVHRRPEARALQLGKQGLCRKTTNPRSNSPAPGQPSSRLSFSCWWPSSWASSS